MERKLVSIIIPIYNTEKYIADCLESVIAQTYRKLEVILVDDGSTDSSPEICKRFLKSDTRIRYYRKENGGSSEARNYGIERSSGEYICFIDSDDTISHHYISTLYYAIIKYKKDIAACGYTSNKKRLGQGSGRIDVCDRKKAMSELLDGVGSNVVCCNKLYNRVLWDTIRFPKGKIYEDIITNYNILKKADGLIFIDLQLYHYRKREGSNSRGNFGEKNYSLLEYIDYIWKDSKKYKGIDRKRLLIGYISLFMVFVRQAVLADACISAEKRKLVWLVRNNLKNIIMAKGITGKKKTELLLFCYMPRVYRYLVRIIKT